jgi:hypothetical protein
MTYSLCVGIENGAARERESFRQLRESQVFRGVKNNGKKEGKGCFVD